MEKKPLTPRQIVDRLDQYIVGQQNAKKAVAVALRNRYRRSLLDEKLKDEVVPKNIFKGCARMPAIVGAFKINAIGTSGVVHIGDCITISPQAQVRTFAGAGSFNTGDSLKVMNYQNATNVYDNDAVDQPIVANA